MALPYGRFPGRRPQPPAREGAGADEEDIVNEAKLKLELALWLIGTSVAAAVVYWPG
ncbi:MAG: hypothetical protein AAGN66_24895 [Acidobacteriota bacterium]